MTDNQGGWEAASKASAPPRQPAEHRYANDPKNASLQYTSLDDLSDKQLLYGIYQRLASIERVLIAGFVIWLVGGAIAAWILVGAVNESGGF